MTQEAIADILGKTQPWVSQHLGFLTHLSPDVQQLAITRGIPFATLRVLATVQPHDVQLEIAQLAVDGAWSHRHVRDYIEQNDAPPNGPRATACARRDEETTHNTAHEERGAAEEGTGTD